MKLASFRPFGGIFSLIGRLGVTKDILTTSNPQKNKSVGGFPNARGLVPDYNVLNILHLKLENIFGLACSLQIMPKSSGYFKLFNCA